jgi:hypothetical protein
MNYESILVIDSSSAAGVRYRIARMSFGRRVELTRRVRELGRKVEFLDAGNGVKEKMEAAVLTAEIERLYLEWGLERVEGLTIDGAPATPASLITDGPENLCREALDAIKRECGLSEEERKN